MSSTWVEQVLVDYVEGRLNPLEFEHRLADAEIATYIRSNDPEHEYAPDPYRYLLTCRYRTFGGRLAAQGLLEAVLAVGGIECRPTPEFSRMYGIVLDCQPSWLDMDERFLLDHVFPPDYEALSKTALVRHARERIKELFRHQGKPPRWIQNPDWPIVDGRPLYFVGQLGLNHERLHDMGAVFVFFDSDDGSFRHVLQLY